MGDDQEKIEIDMGWHSGKLSKRDASGRRVRIWFHKWCCNESLIVFPSLYNMATRQDTWVADVWSPLDVG